MDFGQFTDRARGVIQAAQIAAVAGRHQQLLPEHLLKALIDDGNGVAAKLVRDTGGDPDLLKSAAEEQLAHAAVQTGEGPHPIYMSPALAAVLQGAVESARTGGTASSPPSGCWKASPARAARCAPCSAAPASTRRRWPTPPTPSARTTPPPRRPRRLVARRWPATPAT